jgi:hypothetical protein
MHIARLIIVLFLILALTFTASPLMRGGVNRAWAHARPSVILLMDSLYATLRNFIAGAGSHDGIDDHAPGGNYEIIITKEAGVLF